MGTDASVKLLPLWEHILGYREGRGVALGQWDRSCTDDCTWGTEERPDGCRRAHLRPNGHLFLIMVTSDHCDFFERNEVYPSNRTQLLRNSEGFQAPLKTFFPYSYCSDLIVESAEEGSKSAPSQLCRQRQIIART